MFKPHGRLPGTLHITLYTGEYMHEYEYAKAELITRHAPCHPNTFIVIRSTLYVNILCDLA